MPFFRVCEHGKDTVEEENLHEINFKYFFLKKIVFDFYFFSFDFCGNNGVQ